ncbi:MAG TPA: radical SAM protein [Patescibacteria group bacterium]|nr:radical SAM protein [Patescibacteria group bacterium]
MKKTLLAKTLKNKKVACFTCQRRCQISPDQWGFCQTRINKNGTLKSVIYGVVSSVNLDPIEKKPVFHYKPGSNCLSLGTYGCNFKCAFCFLPDTNIATEKGIYNLKKLFELNKKPRVYSHTGKLRKINKVFRHRYDGKIITIKPYYAPQIECTPSHEFFVTTNSQDNKIQKIKAKDLTKKHYLLIPKNYPFSKLSTFDLNKVLYSSIGEYRKSRKTSYNDILKILELSQNGTTSRIIGDTFNLHPAYVRTLRSRLKNKKIIQKEIVFGKNLLIEKNGGIKFKTEKQPSLPRFIALDKNLAKLLGYYCAEGWVVKNKSRPNSFQISFAFSKKERHYAEEVKKLIVTIFGINPKIVTRETTVTVEIGKSSLALFFKNLCGSTALKKRVPAEINQSPREIIQQFLEGYINGDGWRKPDEIAINTVSPTLAIGIYWLVLKLGFLPRFYKWEPSITKKIGTRLVKQSTLYYVKWKIKKPTTPKAKASTKYIEKNGYYFIPINKINKRKYRGEVFNLEIEKDHSYLANFIGVGNCQNWDISHTNGASINLDNQKLLSPKEAIKMAKKSGAEGIAWTYNEPAIWLEYSLDGAKLAQKEKIYTCWVTNGYATKEAIDKIAPYLNIYRVDLKSFDNKLYKKLIGVPQAKGVFEVTKYVHNQYPEIHLECVTNIIPTWNDSENNLKKIAHWIVKNLGKKTPWHVTRFFPYADLTNVPPTPPETLLKARKIGMKEGLEFVYIGNLPVDEEDDTFCPKCHNLAIRRTGYRTEILAVDKDGHCSDCGEDLNIRM